MSKIFILTIFLLLTFNVSAAKIETGEQLLAAMHKKYSKKWYKTLTFIQKNTEFRADGTTENSMWYEAMSGPGKLRINFSPLEKGDGIMFMDGVQYNFKNGTLTNSHPLVHPLLVLGFDVYLQPVEKTISQVKELKIDLSILHEEILNGREVYVVGAGKGDLKTPQFWVDKKNLYFVKMYDLVGKNKNHIQEIQFNKYQPVRGGGWISPEVVFFVDGKKVFMEEYLSIQTNIKLDENLFIPGNWMTADKHYFEKKGN